MLQLVFFTGCPNAEKAKALLASMHLKFESVEQTELPANHPLRSYTSPTLLCDGKIIFGASAKNLGCTLAIPSAEEIRAALRAK